MNVVASDNIVLGRVVGVQSIIIEAEDGQGKRHWFPLHWITQTTEDKIVLDRRGEHARQEWSDDPPVASS